MDDPELVKIFFNWLRGRDINEIFEGQPLLHRVICADDITLAKMLLRAGAKTEIKDFRGETPLSLAVGIGASRFVLLLLQNGANANARQTYNNMGVTPASPGSAFKNGFTPLMYAAYEGSEELVDLLLAYGADMFVRDYDCHMRADEWAELRGMHDLKNLLRQRRLSNVG